jgi:hypothetical protein
MARTGAKRRWAVRILLFGRLVSVGQARLFLLELSDRFAGHFDSVSVVNEAVAYGVGHGLVANHCVPVIGLNLGSYNRR